MRLINVYKIMPVVFCIKTFINVHYNGIALSSYCIGPVLLEVET